MGMNIVQCAEISLAKFRAGRSCIIDKGTPYEEPGIIVKPPFKNQFREWFVVVAIVSEAMSSEDYEYYPKRFDVRILKERVSLS